MKKMGKNKARILMAALALALLAVIAIPTSYAYFTAKDTTEAAYTFAKIDTEIEEPEPEVQPTYIVKLPSVKNSGDTGCMVRVRLTSSPEQLFTEKALELDVNTKDWTKNGEYYYYNKVLEPTESTSSVIKGIFIRDAEKLNKDFDVAIAQESVQYKLTNGEEYLNAKNADGSINTETASRIWEIYENQK